MVFQWQYDVLTLIIRTERPGHEVMKVWNKAKIGNRYSKVPRLTQGTLWDSDKTQADIINKRAKRPALSKQQTRQYEGCSNMNASSFITFFTYMLRQNGLPFWKELFVAFTMGHSTKKHSLCFSSYRPIYKGHSYILKFFWSKFLCTFWYMCGYSAISL